MQKYNFIVNLESSMNTWDADANPALETSSPQAIGTTNPDPIRRDFGALWYPDTTPSAANRMYFGRWSDSLCESALIKNIVFAPAPRFPDIVSGFVGSSPVSEAGWVSHPNPFGKTQLRMAIYGNPDKFSSLEQWRMYVIANYYGRISGLSLGASPEKHFKYYYDHCYEYNTPFTPLESLRLNLDGVASVASTRFDYNFYAAKYEHLLAQDTSNAYGMPRYTAYPHLYSIYFEADRNLGLGAIEDVAPSEPRITDPDYNDEYTYHDFVTLNRRMKHVFRNTLRKDFTAVPGPGDRPEKAGEGDNARYYNAWSDAYAKFLRRGYDEPTLAGIARLSEKYKNIFLTRRSVYEYQTFNKYKELFPMYTEIQMPFEDVPPPAALNFRDEYREYGTGPFSGRGLHLNVVQNVWHDLTMASPSDAQYRTNFNTMETHQSFATTRINAGARRGFDLTQYCLDSFDGTPVASLDGNPFSYFLFREYPEAGKEIDPDTGLIRDTDAPAYSLPDEDFVPDDDLSGLGILAGQLLTQIRNVARSQLRNYTALLRGDRSATLPVFYKINKYRYSNGARGEFIQSYIIPEGDELFDFIPPTPPAMGEHGDWGNDPQFDPPPPEIMTRGFQGVFGLIDSQMRYDESYEYEIKLYTLVVGTKTKFKHLYIPKDTGGVGEFVYAYTPGGAPPEELDEREGFALGYDRGVPSGGPPSTIPDPRLEEPSMYPGEDYPRIGGDLEPDNPYYAMLDVETYPDIQIIETEYAVASPQWSPQDRSFGIGTILDNPSVAPQIDITPYRAVNNQLLIKFNAGIGSRRAMVTPFSTNDEAYLNRLREMNIDPNDMSIIFENDDPATTFEVYRLDQKPTKYEDFENHRVAEITTDLATTGFRKLSSAAYRDKIQPNRKYYYIFRSVDLHGHASRPSPIYEVELADNDGAVYPVIRLAEFPTLSDYRTNEKKLTRFLQINPQLAQTLLNEEETGTWHTSGGSTTAPNDPAISLGFQDQRIWGRTFKVRLTSRKTGKKMDININMKKEYDPTRPMVLTYDLPTAATPISTDDTGGIGTTGASSSPPSDDGSGSPYS